MGLKVKLLDLSSAPKIYMFQHPASSRAASRTQVLLWPKPHRLHQLDLIEDGLHRSWAANRTACLWDLANSPAFCPMPQINAPNVSQKYPEKILLPLFIYYNKRLGC